MILLRFHVFSFLIFFSFLNYFCKVILWTNLSVLSQIWDYNCKTVFLKLTYCHKLCNANIYPLQVRILQIIFFDVIIKTVFFSTLKYLFSVLDSMVSRNMCNLKNAKNLTKLTWSWQNKPWFKENAFHFPLYGTNPYHCTALDCTPLSCP